MATRDDVCAFALAQRDLGANPADPERRAAYLALIAPRESPSRADGMGSMSGCELLQRAMLRRFINHPLLNALYVTQRAGADLLAIAFEAHAATPGLTRLPDPGDILIVGGGDDGGGPEHAWMLLDRIADPYADDHDTTAFLATGLDGGQRDAGDFQVVRVLDHAVAHGEDHALKASDPGGGLRRKVRWVLNVETIIAKFGR